MVSKYDDFNKLFKYRDWSITKYQSIYSFTRDDYLIYEFRYKLKDNEEIVTYIFGCPVVQRKNNGN